MTSIDKTRSLMESAMLWLLAFFALSFVVGIVVLIGMDPARRDPSSRERLSDRVFSRWQPRLAAYPNSENAIAAHPIAKTPDQQSPDNF